MAIKRAIRLPALGRTDVAAIVLAGLLAAAIDAIYFSSMAIASNRSPVSVLQGIAAFWLGRGALHGGSAAALLGAATHVGLATLMAAGFALLARRFAFFRGDVVAAGTAYGLLLYLIMYLAVMPLRWPAIYPKWAGWRSVFDIAVHMVIGLAIAIVIRRSRSALPAERSYARRVRI